MYVFTHLNGSTTIFLLNRGGCSSVGRAPDCGSGCRGFEPHHPPHLKGEEI